MREDDMANEKPTIGLTASQWLSKMTDREFLEHARMYTSKRGFTVIERLVGMVDNLQTVLKDCSEELADQIEGHYAATKEHPAMKRRYDRDMQPVIRARNLIK